MSCLNYEDINSSGLILTSQLQNKIRPQEEPPLEEPSIEVNVKEGLVISPATQTELDSATYTNSDKAADFNASIEYLNKYKTLYDELRNNRKYDFQAKPDYNPLNDPASHEYVPKIHETALDDTLQKLDFQNRVYAYTSMGLVAVIIAGILLNSNR